MVYYHYITHTSFIIRQDILTTYSLQVKEQALYDGSRGS